MQVTGDVLDTDEHGLDERFADGTRRRANVRALIPLIEEVTLLRSKGEWISRLQSAGVPCGEIADYGSAFEDPHLEARGFFPMLPHPTLGPVRMHARTLGSVFTRRAIS